MSQESEAQTLANQLPKTDLHVHFEGLVTRRQFEAFRAPQQTDELSTDNVFRAHFTDVSDLIRSIRRSNVILNSRSVCAAVLRLYLERSAWFSVRHIELAVEPIFHIERGLGLEELFGGILDALADGELEFGISSLLILSVARDRPVADAFTMLDQIERAGIGIRAIGIAGYADARPLAAFSGFMREATARGYAIIAHAGEGTNAAEIWEAISEFPVHRIDHGISAVADARLVRHLRDYEIPLATAPMSNHLTGTSRNGAAPVALLREGVNVSVNTDDPGILQSSLQDDYSLLIGHQNLSATEVATLASNGFKSSLLAAEQKGLYLAAIDALLESAGTR